MADIDPNAIANMLDNQNLDDDADLAAQGPPAGHSRMDSESVTLRPLSPGEGGGDADFLDAEARNMLSAMGSGNAAPSTSGDNFDQNQVPQQRSAVIMVQITIPEGTKGNQELKARTASGVRIIARAPSTWTKDSASRVIQIAVPRDSAPGSVIRARTPSGFSVKALVPENWTRQAARRKSKIMDPLANRSSLATATAANRNVVLPQLEQTDDEAAKASG